MQPIITTIEEKKLIGLSIILSLTENHTAKLWKTFMPRRKEIEHTIGTNLFSLQVYPSHYFEKFDAARKFRKWALTEVTSLDSIPEDMEAFHLPAGAYACFHYIGNSNDASVFEKIFREWLPASDYVLDDRPHFEILGERYKQGDPNSEETIWIPIKKKE